MNVTTAELEGQGEAKGVDLWVLILTAWQYRFRYVVTFCVGTALLEAALIAISPAQDEMGAMSDMGSLVVRTVFFVLMGYIVSHLMIEQREQRRALAEANRRLVRYSATLEQLAKLNEPSTRNGRLQRVPAGNCIADHRIVPLEWASIRCWWSSGCERSGRIAFAWPTASWPRRGSAYTPCMGRR